MFKKIISALLVFALCLPIGAMTVSAEAEQPATPSETAADAFILDDGTAMTMALSEIDTTETGDVYVYEIEYDGILDHTIQVDMENDATTIIYADGSTETLVTSEHVRVTKIPVIKAPTVHSANEALLALPDTISPTPAASGTLTNYIYNEEPFELDANGNQMYLDNYVYPSGFEYVGKANFTNPNESAYLVRKPMGCELFNHYYYEIDVGTTIYTVIAVIATYLNLQIGAIESAMLILAYDLWPIVSGEVSLFTRGELMCVEGRWDYRVCRDPYSATLLTVTKYRYWWRMNVKDATGNEIDYAYETRTDIVDGCQYSNIDIVAAGLGRIVIYV